MQGYRTLAVNAAVALFGVLAAFDWTSVLGSKTAGIVVAAVAFANMALRTMTSTPVGTKPTDTEPKA